MFFTLVNGLPIDALALLGPEAVRVLDRARVHLLVFGVVEIGARLPLRRHLVDLAGHLHPSGTRGRRLAGPWLFAAIMRRRLEQDKASAVTLWSREEWSPRRPIRADARVHRARHTGAVKLVGDDEGQHAGRLFVIAERIVEPSLLLVTDERRRCPGRTAAEVIMTARPTSQDADYDRSDR